MIEVVLTEISVARAVDIVHELRTSGLQDTVDFTFAYKPSKYDDITGHLISERQVVFAFSDDSMASWFTLKYLE